MCCLSNRLEKLKTYRGNLKPKITGVLLISSRISDPTHTRLCATTAHWGLWPVEQCPSIFSYLPPTHSIFSLPTLEDLFLLPLSIFSWIFPFFSSLPVLRCVIPVVCLMMVFIYNLGAREWNTSKIGYIYIFFFFFFFHWHYSPLWVWPVEQCLSIFSYLPPTLSIFSLPALKISFYFLFPSFPGSSPSSRPFQF